MIALFRLGPRGLRILAQGQVVGQALAPQKVFQLGVIICCRHHG